MHLINILLSDFFQVARIFSVIQSIPLRHYYSQTCPTFFLKNDKYFCFEMTSLFLCFPRGTKTLIQWKPLRNKIQIQLLHKYIPTFRRKCLDNAFTLKHRHTKRSNRETKSNIFDAQSTNATGTCLPLRHENKSLSLQIT